MIKLLQYSFALVSLVFLLQRAEASQISMQGEADSLCRIADTYFLMDTDSSHEAYSLALGYYINMGNTKGEMKCLTRLAAIYDDKGNSDTAIVLAYRAINIGLTHSYDTLLAETYLRLGNMYREMNQYQEARDFYYQVIGFGFSNSTNGAWGSLGILFSNIEEYDSAHIFLLKSLSYFKGKDTSSHRVLYNIASLAGSMGVNSFKCGKPKEGLSYFSESLRISRKIGNEINIVSNLLNFSIAYDMENMPRKAEEVLQEAYDIANRIHNQRLKSRVYLLMSDHYYEIDNFKSAYDYIVNYQNLNDSIGRVDYQESLHKSELKYLKQLQDIELAKLEVEKENDQLQFVLVLGIFSFLFVAITLFLYRKVKIRTAEKRKFEQKSELLNSRLIDATARLLEMDLHLQEQNTKLFELQKQAQSKNKNDLDEVSKELENRKILLNEDWGEYVEIFNILHPVFLENLLKDYPSLTEGDKRQLIMIKLDYARKKSALILGISPESVKRAQQRVANKLKLKDVTELSAYVKGV
ncbi:MAG: hypothetical protein DRI84_05940 [Bacteroidetes bacterium]|nr:MAG: hypothetical protein DRI84_05940 [Bacteroidota bacterium]